jgi:predicted transposase/invertase (TIGR01784 family)
VLKLSQDQQLLYKTDSIAKVYPEYYIIKVNQFDEVAKNTLDELIYFFKTEEIKDEFNAKGIKQAKKELTILNLSDSERREYEKFIEQERYEESLIVSNYRVGELKGEIKGKAEGKIEQQLEIATQMYKDGEPVEKIMKYTGLSNEEVQKLK